MRFSLAVTVVVVALGSFLAPSARAEEDAADLLRRAKTAETVDRDVARAKDLYRRALQLAPDSPAGGEAADALARLEDEASARAQATRLLARALDEEQRLSSAEQRWFVALFDRFLAKAAGRPSEERGSASASAAPSPLERKIEDLLSRLDDAPPDQRARVRNEVNQALWPLGKDVMPVLERIVFGARPERAEIAAEAYARIGGADALPGLVRAVREGDPFTREAAVDALVGMHLKGEDGARYVAAVEPLLSDQRAAAAYGRLLQALAAYLTPEALMERHRRGGAAADAWLAYAVRIRAPGAEERALELAKPDDGSGEAWLARLLEMHVPSAVPLALVRFKAAGEPGAAALRGLLLMLSNREPGAFDAATQLALLDLHLEQPEPWNNLRPVASLLESVHRAQGAGVTNPRAQQLWARLPAAGAWRIQVHNMLASLGLHPEPARFADPAFADAYFEMSVQRQLPASLLKSETFWNGLFDALPRLTPTGRRAALTGLEPAVTGAAVDPPVSPRWFDVLALSPFQDADQVPPFVFRGAARTGDARWLEYVRTAVRAHRGGPGGPSAIQSLTEYSGPGLLEFLRATLAETEIGGALRDRLFAILAENAGEEGRREVIRIARTWDHPEAPRALRSANAEAPMEGLDQVYRRAERATLPPISYRRALIAIAQNLHHRPAVRYLVREYRGGPLSGDAGKALDSIRAYHEKIETFERWARGGDFDASDRPAVSLPPLLVGARLQALLAHDDAEVRRASAVSLGALGEKSALPALEQLAASDPDEGVRAAAQKAAAALR
jgi:hypothetical protein